MKEKLGLFIMTSEVACKIMELPVEEREAYLIQLTKAKEAELLGYTDKTAPELAVELIKKGIRAKSYIKGDKNG